MNALSFPGSINKHPIDYSHPYIVRDANKCINCGRCVRTCAEIQGPAVLGYIYRGFAAVVAPEFGESLTQTTCESCGKCIAVCPVGALVERNLHYKQNPLPKTETLQNCGLCGTGCYIKVEDQSGVVTRIETPSEMTCKASTDVTSASRSLWLAGPLVRRQAPNPQSKENGVWRDISWQEAKELIASKATTAQKKRFDVSASLTIEELLIAKKPRKAVEQGCKPIPAVCL